MILGVNQPKGGIGRFFETFLPLKTIRVFVGVVQFHELFPKKCPPTHHVYEANASCCFLWWMGLWCHTTTCSQRFWWLPCQQQLWKQLQCWFQCRLRWCLQCRLWWCTSTSSSSQCARQCRGAGLGWWWMQQCMWRCGMWTQQRGAGIQSLCTLRKLVRTKMLSDWVVRVGKGNDKHPRCWCGDVGCRGPCSINTIYKNHVIFSVYKQMCFC